MEELKIYHSPIFGTIRIITKDGEYYGNGKDVATILDYRNHNDAIRRHCRKEGIIKHEIIDSMGRTQQANFLDENNLYCLITHSKFPEAQAFEHWLFNEVLPSTRKEGLYVSMELLRQIKENRELLKQLLQQIDTALHQKASTQVIREATFEKANFFDRCMDTAGLTNIRMTAKELNLSERKFISFLLRGGFLYRAPDGTLLPYTNEKNRRIFTVKEFRKNKHHGLQTYITAEGRALFAMLCLPDEGTENE